MNRKTTTQSLQEEKINLLIALHSRLGLAQEYKVANLMYSLGGLDELKRYKYSDKK